MTPFWFMSHFFIASKCKGGGPLMFHLMSNSGIVHISDGSLMLGCPHIDFCAADRHAHVLLFCLHHLYNNETITSGN